MKKKKKRQRLEIKPLKAQNINTEFEESMKATAAEKTGYLVGEQ